MFSCSPPAAVFDELSGPGRILFHHPAQTALSGAVREGFADPGTARVCQLEFASARKRTRRRIRGIGEYHPRERSRPRGLPDHARHVPLEPTGGTVTAAEPGARSRGGGVFEPCGADHLGDPGDIGDQIPDGLRRAETIVSTAIQECFQQAKGEAGLDHYQVRSWRAWYAHITLSMLALAWPAASKAQTVKGNRHQRPGHDRLHGTGDPQAPDRLNPDPRSRPRTRLVLVALAAATTVPSPALPLQTPRLCT